MRATPLSTKYAARWLRFPSATWLALVIGALLSIPALSLGLLLDDYHQLNEASIPRPPWQALDLYRFLPSDPDALQSVIRNGPFPWWTDPRLKLALWRPLASALIRFDVRVFGTAIWLHHLHSVIWYLALIAAVAALLRRTLPGALGAGALLLFAIDNVHWMPVSWLAHRNALVAAAPAFMGLVAHVRWREERWWPGLPLSLLGFAVGLAGGEGALGVGCYLVAYEVAAGPGRLRSRLRALLPATMLGTAYIILYRSLGYGARWSGAYVDPFASPVAFITLLPTRLLAMSAGQLVLVPADLRVRAVPIACGALALACIAAMLRRAWSGVAQTEQRHVRWLLIGASLSMLPVASTTPHNRLLLLPSLGGAVLVAVLVRYGWTAVSRLDRAAAYVLLVIHVPLSVLGWVSSHHTFATAGPRTEEVLLARDLDMASRRVVLLVAPDFATLLYAPSVRAYREAPKARAWWSLSAAPFDHRLTRTGGRTFELEVVGGRMLTTPFEQLFRRQERVLHVGEHVRLDGLTVEVLDADDQGLRRVGFRFAVPLEDPSLLVLEWRDGKLQPAALPPIGNSRYLPYAPGPLSSLGF